PDTDARCTWRRLKMSRSKRESEHLARVKALPCSVCNRPSPSDAHHPRFAVGAGQRASDWLAIALCKECHQGASGIHGDRSAWRLRKMDEPDALAVTLSRLL